MGIPNKMFLFTLGSSYDFARDGRMQPCTDGKLSLGAAVEMYRGIIKQGKESGLVPAVCHALTACEDPNKAKSRGQLMSIGYANYLHDHDVDRGHITIAEAPMFRTIGETLAFCTTILAPDLRESWRFGAAHVKVFTKWWHIRRTEWLLRLCLDEFDPETRGRIFVQGMPCKSVADRRTILREQIGTLFLQRFGRQKMVETIKTHWPLMTNKALIPYRPFH